MDMYTGCGVVLSNLKYISDSETYTKGLVNPQSAFYVRLTFMLFKGLHISSDFGLQYQRHYQSISHKKICWLYPF